MSWLSTLIEGFFKALIEWLKGIWKYTTDSVSWFWMSVVGGFTLAFHEILSTFTQIVTAATDVITNVALPILHLPPLATETYKLANTFAPLTELLGFCSAYLAFIGVLTGYRLIKSWIPTLS